MSRSSRQPAHRFANLGLRFAEQCVRACPGGRRARKPAHVLVVRLGNIGDTVVALPAFHALRRRFPRARMTLLTSPTRRGAVGAREVLENDATFDDIWVYHADESQRPGFLRGLRRRIVDAGIDLAVALPNHMTTFPSLAKYVALLATCGVRCLVGFKLVERADHGRPQVERLAELLAPLGANDIEPLPWLVPGEEAERRADALLEGLGGLTLVGMHCGATRPANQWFPERFAELGRQIVAESGARVVLTGAVGDTARTKRVAAEIGDAALNLAGLTSIPELAAVARRCRLFVSNDTGAMHLAYAVGTPVLALFSARFYPQVWYPYGPRSRVLRAELPCSPCHADTCPLADRPPCLEAISVEDAYNAACDMLRHGPG